LSGLRAVNSALGGLGSNAGVLELDSGAQVQINGDFFNSGLLEVEYYYIRGGSTLAIAGTLGNTGSVERLLLPGAPTKHRRRAG